MNVPMVSFGSPPRLMTLEEFLARPRYSPYRYDPDKVGSKPDEEFAHMIHMLATTEAMCYAGRCSLVSSVEEVAAKERESAEWNKPGGFNGD